jgi:hypothetical protein
VELDESRGAKERFFKNESQEDCLQTTDECLDCVSTKEDEDFIGSFTATSTISRMLREAYSCLCASVNYALGHISV